jgi:hypothetical protein
MKKPTRKDISLYANAAFSEDIQIIDSNGSPQDITGWVFRVAGKILRTSATPDITGTATIVDNATGLLNIYFPQADIATMLASAASLKLERWDLLCKPGVAYPLLLMYGEATVETGSTPAW